MEGWIYDLYPGPQGMTLWLMEANQRRHRLMDRFAPAFYVAGAEERLRRVQSAFAKNHASADKRAIATKVGGPPSDSLRENCGPPLHPAITCRVTEKQDIWERRARQVLEIRVVRPTDFFGCVQWAHRFDARLRFYNSDLMLAPMYCWEKKIFPLARVEVEADAQGCVQAIGLRDDEWALDYELPPLEILQVRLKGYSQMNPEHGQRAALEVEAGGRCFEIEECGEPAAATFARLLKQHDPDLILSEWGDATILPLLRQQAERLRLPLRLNRDAAMEVQQSRARSYMSYGRMLFKNSATTLFGRLHVDTRNSFIAGKCDLSGLWELVRVTKLPVQYAARTSTGTGISYMQMELAWRDGVLIPEQKAEPEDPKSPDELLAADRGGLVFTPKLGFFAGVGELDFVSEYPSIMARFNISPETVNCPCCPAAPRVPELGYRVCQQRRGITSRVVERLIAKRSAWKQMIRGAPKEATARYKLQRDSLKWLLVCCFGYTGYKNARFGKIEAHEAINAVARETLLVAKEMAEARGFEVLHALVDSLYVYKHGAGRVEFEALAQEIEHKTQLPIAVEAIYRYVVFLPSRQFADIPVPNRFFAVSDEGELKVRGLELRRHDTAPIVAGMQREALEILRTARDYDEYCEKLKEARGVLERYEQSLEDGTVAVEDLVIRKRLSKPPREYSQANITTIVAQQLYGRGVKLRPGEMVEFVLTNVEARVPNDRARAWALWEGWFGYDRKKYRQMLREGFEPFEVVAIDAILTDSTPTAPKEAVLACKGQGSLLA